MASSPVVSASGQIICHRFYYFYSFQQCHPFFGSSCFASLTIVAMACFFIGSKIEEELQPVPRTVKAFYQIYQERTGQPLTQLTDTDPVLYFPIYSLDLYSLEEHPLRNGAARALRLRLPSLRRGRPSPSLHPLLHQSGPIHLPYPQKLGFGSVLAQRAWNILNDRCPFPRSLTPSQQLPLCVAYSASSIACAAIYLAAMLPSISPFTRRSLELQLPAVEWWELFDCSAEEIQQIIHSIVQLYQRNRIVWLSDASDTHGQRCSFVSLADSEVVSPETEAKPLV